MNLLFKKTMCGATEDLMLLFWSNLIVAGKVMWLERWEGSDLAKWEVWESGKAGKLEE